MHRSRASIAAARPLRGVAAAALLASACGQGGLEQADFAPACAPGDLACATGGIDAPLALGAVLPLDLDLQLVGSAGPGVELVAADAAVLKVSGNEVRGEAVGRSALLATTGDGLVIDFTHVWVAAPTRVALHRLSEAGDAGEIAGPIELLVGDELELGLVPYADGARLGGRVEGAWSVSGAAVTALATGALGRRRLVAREVGSAEVAVVLADREIVVTVEVLP